ncbi:hypothetical protein ONE63_010376 [Megalurothrips usitatus]|uniref:Uncharacterized protein n=1 Tax=Megalurothrips usitatus TaxID=439358 RepID=A0AAV7XQ72_9NEOP|nr:hypothetical protein ONE63_010376 [Megalurothrips usitatus]
MDPRDTPSPPKKKRGPYKTYLLNPSSGKEIPGGTLRSRKKNEEPREEQNAVEDVEGEDVIYEQHPQELDESQDDENGVTQNVAGSQSSFQAQVYQQCSSRSVLSEEESEHDGSTQRDGIEEGGIQYELAHGSSEHTPEDQQETNSASDSEGIESPSASTCDSLGEDEMHGEDEMDGEAEMHGEDNMHGEDEPKQKVDYNSKYHLNEKLRLVSPLSRLDALLIILHQAIRHCHTQAFIEDQIKFVNALFGSPVLDISYHVFKNVFPPSSNVQRHYYCGSCEIYVGSCEDFPKDLSSTNCPRPECNREIILHSIDSKNYFITLSIKDQIESILSRPNVKLVEKCIRNTDDICDVFDGELYKRFSQINGNGDVLTCVMNTDGVQVYEDNRGSLYPFFLHLNELVPEIRYKQENLTLGGLWFGKGAPNMALYLKPILSQLMSLSQSGVTVPGTHGNEKRPLFAIGLSVDSVAKAKILCQRQFNGGYSCLYCYHPNDSIADEGKPHLKHFDTSASYPNRTEEEVIKDMVEADTLQRSNLLNLFGVFLVYLLALYLTILSEEKLDIVNTRLDQVTLPQGMSRKPRHLDSKVKYKAKEYRSFFLYFAIPCLEDLLPPRHFQNLKLFVSALHILLSDKISRGDLETARKDLNDFVISFQALYGLEKVTYNLHLCTHHVDMVIQSGPIWTNSNFIFESGNGLLVKLVRGTRSVINEISVKFSRLQTAQQQIVCNPVSNEALLFCSGLLGCKYSKAERYDDVSVTASQAFMQVSDHEGVLLEGNNVPVVNNKVKVFNRVLRNGLLYVSKSYLKTKSTNDSCVQMQDGSYANIDKIVSTNDKLLMCIVQPIRLAEGINFLPAVKKCAFDVHATSSIVSFSQICRKCVFINFDSKSFVIDIPNFYERD